MINKLLNLGMMGVALLIVLEVSALLGGGYIAKAIIEPPVEALSETEIALKLLDGEL